MQFIKIGLPKIVCLSTHMSKQTFKMQELNLHVINEAVYAMLGLLQTVWVVVNEGGASLLWNCETRAWLCAVKAVYS